MDLKKVKPFTHAGVIALYERLSDSIILTKRTETLRMHPGEVCFPGGVYKSFYDTALRELHEELGIAAHRISLIKKLSIERTLLGTIIHPWLATIDVLDPLNINTNEVEHIISISLSLVQNSQNYKDIMVKRKGITFKTCQFIADKEFVWGATARIMKQLIVYPKINTGGMPQLFNKEQ